MSPSTGVEGLAPWQFDMYVGAEADGVATPAELAVLEANPIPWRAALVALLRDAEEHLESARSLSGEERAQVIADLESERRRLAAAYARLTHDPSVEERDPARGPSRQASGAGRAPIASPSRNRSRTAQTELQVSWEPGRVVAWGGGLRAPVADRAQVTALLAAAGAPETGWSRHTSVPLPAGGTADALGDPGRRRARLARRRGCRQRRRRHRGERALVGTGRDLGRRADGAWRDGAAAPAAGAAQPERTRVERIVLGALDAGARRCRTLDRDVGRDARHAARARSQGRSHAR